MGSEARAISVDVLRGATIAVMVLVNDAEEALRAPASLKHVPHGATGMTIADVVVPAFTLVVGLSVPLAVHAQLTRGKTRGEVFRHVLGRTVSLLVMGVFMFARHSTSAGDPRVWMGLMYLSFVGAWCVVPREPGWRRSSLVLLKIFGIFGLLALAWQYRGPKGEYLVLGPLFDPAQTVWLVHGWWEILGQLGWAYFVTGTIFLFAGPRRAVLVTAALALVMLYPIADQSAVLALDGPSVHPLVDPLLTVVRAIHAHVDLGRTIGIPGVMAMVGCVVGVELVEGRSAVRAAAGLTALLAIGALAFLPAYGVSKHASTPSWALASCAITLGLWAAGAALASTRIGAAWARRASGALVLLGPAAQNALLVYFLHPLVRGAIAVVPGLGVLAFYKGTGVSAAVATAGCVAMVVLVLALVRIATALGLRVRA
ncbi:DUF5009 domain-containing protein [Myxococcota bacterium]|nr:DUF5009 domain-containing protein [Myxococcota bacterium]